MKRSSLLRYAPIGLILLLTGSCGFPKNKPEPIEGFFARKQALEQKTFTYQDTLRVVFHHEPEASVQLYAKTNGDLSRPLYGTLLARSEDRSVFQLVLDDPEWDSGECAVRAVMSKGAQREKKSLLLNYIGLERRLEAFLVLSRQKLHRLVPGDSALSEPVPLVNRLAVSSSRGWLQLWDSTSTVRLYDADNLQFLARGNWNGPGRRLGMSRPVRGRITTLGLSGSFLQWDSGPRQVNRHNAGDSAQVYSFSGGTDFLCFLTRMNPGGSSRLHAMHSNLTGVFTQRLLGTGRYHLAEMEGIGPGLLEQANGQTMLYHYQPLQQLLVAGRSGNLPPVDRVKRAQGGMLCAAGKALYFYSYQKGPRLLANGVIDFAFNPEDQRVYFLQQNGIYSLPLAGGTPRQEMPFSGQGRALALLFNKG